MSGSLTWLLTKNNSSFLYKKGGAQFSAEPGNLMNKNTWKYSGLANKKTIDVAAAEKGFVLTTQKKKGCNKPNKVRNSAVLKTDVRRAALAITNVTVKCDYRPDLQKAAIARAAAILRSQKPRKTITKKATGVRAARAAARK